MTTTGAQASGQVRARRTHVERRAATVEKLLQATIDLLLEKGYSCLRVADIAARAGVSRGGQAHHFATKDELIEAVIERLFASEVGHTILLCAEPADSYNFQWIVE